MHTKNHVKLSWPILLQVKMQSSNRLEGEVVKNSDENGFSWRSVAKQRSMFHKGPFSHILQLGSETASSVQGACSFICSSVIHRRVILKRTLSCPSCQPQHVLIPQNFYPGAVLVSDIISWKNSSALLTSEHLMHTSSASYIATHCWRAWRVRGFQDTHVTCHKTFVGDPLPKVKNASLYSSVMR